MEAVEKSSKNNIWVGRIIGLALFVLGCYFLTYGKAEGREVSYVLSSGTVTANTMHCDEDGWEDGYEKIYIDEQELQSSVDAFHIHIGNNLWIQTDTLNRDNKGLYTYSHQLLRHHKAIEKKWKCPYCFQYWPVGSPCKNEYCPSRYK